MSSIALIRDLNTLRTMRHHLAHQVGAGIDTQRSTCAEARGALAEVEAGIAVLEPQARELPEAAYLFGRGRRRRTGRTRVLSPQSIATTENGKEDGMARKSNAAALEETLVALRRAEKSAGTTKWALNGAGAKRNPPDAKRKKALTAKLAKEQALVAGLRATRDELKTKAG